MRALKKQTVVNERDKVTRVQDVKLVTEKARPLRARRSSPVEELSAELARQNYPDAQLLAVTLAQLPKDQLLQRFPVKLILRVVLALALAGLVFPKQRLVLELQRPLVYAVPIRASRNGHSTSFCSKSQPASLI